MLGGIQSLKDGLNDDAPSTKIYDTDVIEFPMSSSSSYTAYANNPTIGNELPAEWLSESPTSSMEKFETLSIERGERYVCFYFCFKFLNFRMIFLCTWLIILLNHYYSWYINTNSIFSILHSLHLSSYRKFLIFYSSCHRCDNTSIFLNGITQ
jgi:hypothetical protein